MADSKLSVLTSATTLSGSDVFYIVQSSTSKKITAANLFANASNVILNGNVNYDSNVQSLGSAGIIDITKPISHVFAGASGGTLTMPNGTTNQQKIIVMTTTSGGSYTLSGNIAGNATIAFTAAGNTATMLYTNSKWFFIGGTASVT